MGSPPCLCDPGQLRSPQLMPGLWREGRCHSPSPGRPRSWAAGVAVSGRRRRRLTPRGLRWSGPAGERRAPAARGLGGVSGAGWRPGAGARSLGLGRGPGSPEGLGAAGFLQGAGTRRAAAGEGRHSDSLRRGCVGRRPPPCVGSVSRSGCGTFAGGTKLERTQRLVSVSTIP